MLVFQATFKNFHPNENGMARSIIALVAARSRSSLGDHFGLPEWFHLFNQKEIP
jgi:hypothetical protein